MQMNHQSNCMHKDTNGRETHRVDRGYHDEEFWVIPERENIRARLEVAGHCFIAPLVGAELAERGRNVLQVASQFEGGERAVGGAEPGHTDLTIVTRRLTRAHAASATHDVPRAIAQSNSSRWVHKIAVQPNRPPVSVVRRSSGAVRCSDVLGAP